MTACPFSADGEKGVLCSLILSLENVAIKCSSRLPANAFYVPAHRIIYELLLDFADKKQPAEFSLLVQALRDRGQLEEVGEKEFLNELFGFVPTGNNAEYYIGIVLEKYHLRRLKLLGDRMSAKSDDPQTNPEDLLTETQAEIEEISKISSPASAPISFKKRVLETFEWIKGLYDNPPTSVVSFGIPRLDRALLPVEPGSLIIVSGPTGGGKTALALQAALRSTGRTIGIFSLEMPSRQLVARVFANQGQINLANLRRGRWSEPEGLRLQRVVTQLGARQIYIEDRQPIDVRLIGAASRLWKQDCGLEVIILDYLQLITPAAHKRDNSREREIAEISRSLKTLAMELGVVVIALSQLNDQGQLRESRAIGQDADIVVQIEEDEGEVVVRVKKNRNGPCASVPVTFSGECQRFTERMPDCPPAASQPDEPEPDLNLFRNGNGKQHKGDNS